MKRHFGALITILVLPLLIVACGDSPPDRSAAAAREIIKADQEFAWLAERSSVSHAFATYLDEGAVLLPDGGSPLRGKALQDAIEAMDFNLEWAPEQAWAARSGDFGITWGYWTMRAIDMDGNPVVTHGKYTSVWRRNADGDWKLLMDMGNEGPEPAYR